MVDQLDLFDAICNNIWFEKTKIILVLTHTDLFKKKIQNIPLNTCPAFANQNDDINELHRFVKGFENFRMMAMGLYDLILDRCIIESLDVDIPMDIRMTIAHFSEVDILYDYLYANDKGKDQLDQDENF